MKFIYTDGGRAKAGLPNTKNDCVYRSIAIATETPYEKIYSALNQEIKNEKFRRGRIGHAAAIGRGSSDKVGVFKETFRPFIASLGWVWTPTMGIGTGCKVHLNDGELPTGRLIVQTSKHVTAVIDGVIHDNHDPSRDGTRCVYGYWSKGK